MEAPIARPDVANADHLSPEGDVSLQPSIEKIQVDATPIDENIGGAGEEGQVVQTPAERPQMEQGLVDQAPDSVSQEIPQDVNSLDAPEQQVLVGEPTVDPLSQDGSSLQVEAPITDAQGAEPTPASDSLVFAPIDQSDSDPSLLKCTNCGRDIDASDIFCPDCGFDVKK